MLYTSYYLVDKMNGVFKEQDITRQQYNVLRILRGQHPGHASINLIKERMLDKMSDASRIVERLRIKGLITREYCETDKRSVEVTITKEGLALLQQMQPAVEAFESLFYNLTEDETKELNLLLDKIRTDEGKHMQEPSANPKTEKKISTLATS